MTDELRAKITMDTSNFVQGAEVATEKLDMLNLEMDRVKRRTSKLGELLGSISPSFKKVSDSWKDVSSKMDAGTKRAGKGFGGMKVAAVAAIAVIGIEFGKVAAKVADETARMFDPQAYSKAQGKLDKSIKRLKTAAGSITAPLVNGLKKLASGIIDAVTRQIERLSNVLHMVAGFLSSVFEPIVDAVRGLVQWLKEGINSIAAILGLGKVFKEVARESGEAADNVGEIVEATSAGLASFDKLSTLDFSGMGDSEEAEKIKESAEDYNEAGKAFGEKVKEALGNIGTWLKNIDLGQMWESFKDKAYEAWEGVKKWGSEAWSKVKGWGEDTWNGLKESAGKIWDGLTGAWDTVKTKILGFFDELIPDIDLGKVWDDFYQDLVDLKNDIPQFFEDLASDIKGALSGVWGALTGTKTSTGNTNLRDPGESLREELNETKLPESVASNAQNVSNTIEKINGGEVEINVPTLTGMANTLSSGLSKIKEIGENVYNEAKNSNKNSFWKNLGKTIGIGDGKGWFASGGVIDPNNPHLIGVGDNTTEREVISPVSTMKSAFKQALYEASYSGGANGGGTTGGSTSRTTQNITLNIDGRQLARLTFDDFMAEARRRGIKVGQ